MPKEENKSMTDNWIISCRKKIYFVAIVIELIMTILSSVFYSILIVFDHG